MLSNLELFKFLFYELLTSLISLLFNARESKKIFEIDEDKVKYNNIWIYYDINLGIGYKYTLRSEKYQN